MLTVAGGTWRKHFAGGADCELVVAGRTTPMHGELSEDPDDVTGAYAALIERVGLKGAQRLGLRVVEERMPTHAELVEALRGEKGVVRFTGL